MSKLLLMTFPLFLIIQSCSHNLDHKANTEPSIQEDFRNIELMDRFNNPLFKDTAFLMTTAEFTPLYIGKEFHQINLTYKPEEITNNRLDEWDIFKRPKQDSIVLYVDNSRSIGIPMSVWEYHKIIEYRPSKLGYPVFIKNISKAPLEIGFGDMLPIVIEAIDRKGNWRPIQKRFSYDCGTGLSILYLKPEQIAIASMKIFEGNYTTRLRLAYGYKNEPKIHSNEIIGKIYETQFYDYDKWSE